MTFVDKDPKVVKALQANAARLNARGSIIVRSIARKFLAGAAQPWDIVFLDPPFAEDDLATTLDALRQHNLVSHRGLVYFEASRRLELELPGWTLIKESTVGESRFGLLAPVSLPPTV